MMSLRLVRIDPPGDGIILSKRAERFGGHRAVRCEIRRDRRQLYAEANVIQAL